ncbi:MAG: 1-acyl-sn-glycerol-3-phosphate acyltransferase [Spirochaetales bacterium]|nr:1-acyl-sn-glycerol-3-phosphate acyltransferase [Spirochaetales bacterium]
MNNEFNDIRPYSEEEFPEVLHRLVNSPYLHETLRKIKWPGCPLILRGVANLVIKQFIRKQMRGIKTREDFQQKLIIDKFMHWIIENTTNGLSFSGHEKLDRDTAYLYISNHRDIVLDVAFITCAMVDAKLPFIEIAIGDNLLMNQFVEDLIRINRSFIVRRNLPLREQIGASLKLSKYINHTMKEGNSLWIAQREGRAKDGKDLTNPAILKMLYLSERKSEKNFSEYINSMNLVPVSINYELDPLDNLKAWEIYRKETRGEHTKRKHEDLISMYFGIKGMKGRVHLNFGEPLRGNFPSDKSAADAIDNFICYNYKIWPTNYIAFDSLNEGDRFKDKYTEEEKIMFLKRFRHLPSAVRKIGLRTYAEAVEKKISMERDA